MIKYRRGLVKERVVCIERGDWKRAKHKVYSDGTVGFETTFVCFFFSMKLASVCKLNWLRSTAWLWEQRVVEVT